MSDMKGLDKMIANLQKLKDLDVAKIASAGAYTVISEAQRLAPVKTGYLRSTAYVEPVDGKGCEFGFSADYAFYNEFGSSRMPARPYLRPAIDTKQEEALANMANEAKKQVEGKLK